MSDRGTMEAELERALAERQKHKPHSPARESVGIRIRALRTALRVEEKREKWDRLMLKHSGAK